MKGHRGPPGKGRRPAANRSPKTSKKLKETVTDHSAAVNEDRELNALAPETPGPESAVTTLGDNQHGSEAIVPLPLAIVVKRAGMLYREIFRSGDVTIYCAKGGGNRIEYEVFKAQILPAQELNGRNYLARESFPSNSEWGQLGFTYTNNSHRAPLAAALAKAQQLASRRAADGKELD